VTRDAGDGGYLAVIRRGLLGQFVDETREAHVAGTNGQPANGVNRLQTDSERLRGAVTTGLLLRPGAIVASDVG
jgi:hypothetical protein